jgi:hypothetical protein
VPKKYELCNSEALIIYRPSPSCPRIGRQSCRLPGTKGQSRTRPKILSLYLKVCHLLSGKALFLQREQLRALYVSIDLFHRLRALGISYQLKGLPLKCRVLSTFHEDLQRKTSWLFALRTPHLCTQTHHLCSQGPCLESLPQSASSKPGQPLP